MLDYLSFPPASLRRVVHPGQQVVGHRWNNVVWGIPAQLVRQFYRPANLAAGRPVEWYLPPDHPAWEEALPYIEAWKLYYPREVASPGPPGHAEAEAARAAVRAARADWWERAYALPQASDPNWRYAAAAEHDATEFDDDIMLLDDSRPEVEPRYPRRELRASYGTACFATWAATVLGPLPS